jgi:hypothetical protein
MIFVPAFLTTGASSSSGGATDLVGGGGAPLREGVGGPR